MTDKMLKIKRLSCQDHGVGSNAIGGSIAMNPHVREAGFELYLPAKISLIDAIVNIAHTDLQLVNKFM